MKKSIEISPNIETLFGTRDENLHVLEDGLNIAIDLKSDSIELEGAPRDVGRAEQVFTDYDQLQRSGFTFNNGDLNSMLRVLMADPKATLRGLAAAGRQRSFGRRTVQPKSVNQRRYLEAIEKYDMVEMAMATARYVLPVPAGPMPNTISYFSRAGGTDRSCPARCLARNPAVHPLPPRGARG